MTLATERTHSNVSGNEQINALWLTLNPSLKRLDQRLLCHLSRRTKVHRWEYVQTVDEPCCTETVLALLHETITAQNQPLHLLGHGINGALALLYARRYPQQVRSLTLLSVAGHPGVTWHSHYYAMRALLPCDRQMLLLQVARMLLGPICPAALKALGKLLESDLDGGFAPHSLANTTPMAGGPITTPLLVCFGQQDIIIDPYNRRQWSSQFTAHESALKHGHQSKPRFWECPEGHHFFHFEAPGRVAAQIWDYWSSLAPQAEIATVRR
jgi:pimeloyl-ACP methyl ester carboxylesterase